MILSVFLSCQDKRREQIALLVSEWQGKEIVFPEELIFTCYAQDTIDQKVPDTDFKILIYVDSVGCTSCKLQLNKWKELMVSIDSIAKEEIPFLFFFHPKSREDIEYLLKSHRFDYPVCVDYDDQMNNLNKFPSEINFQTFLLDQNNKVILIGNPVVNLSVKDLYFKYIRGEDLSDSKILKTSVAVETPVIDMGTLKMSEAKEAVFRLKNTGKDPLVVLDAVSSCGCVVVAFDKKPVLPGEYVKIGVNMTPKKKGFFDEVITLKSNAEFPIQLKIKGHAE